MKRLLTLSLLLFSFNGWAETYSCQTMVPQNFTLSRVQWTNELTQFKYQTKDSEMLYSIVRESERYIHLVRDYVDSASYMIIGKEDESYVGVFIGYESSSQVFKGSCFKVN